MKNDYLIFMDLDGTALFDWETITDETVSTIKKVSALGHKVCIATGRPYRSSKVFYDKLNLKTPIINYNGALIHHPYNKHFDEISREINLYHILMVFNDIGHLIENAFCEYYEDIYLFRANDDIMPLIHPEGGKLIIGDFTRTLHLNPNGFILLAYPNTIMQVETYLKNNFQGLLNIRNWGGQYPQIFEVYNPETNKGNALKIIGSYFDIPQDRIMAFGDGENDVEMIMQAGIGIAMENAVANVKKAAKFHTLSNLENGVAHFLNSYFNLI